MLELLETRMLLTAALDEEAAVHQEESEQGAFFQDTITLAVWGATESFIIGLPFTAIACLTEAPGLPHDIDNLSVASLPIAGGAIGAALGLTSDILHTAWDSTFAEETKVKIIEGLEELSLNVINGAGIGRLVGMLGGWIKYSDNEEAKKAFVFRATVIGSSIGSIASIITFFKEGEEQGELARSTPSNIREGRWTLNAFACGLLTTPPPATGMGWHGLLYFGSLYNINYLRNSDEFNSWITANIETSLQEYSLIKFSAIGALGSLMTTGCAYLIANSDALLSRSFLSEDFSGFSDFPFSSIGKGGLYGALVGSIVNILHTGAPLVVEGNPDPHSSKVNHGTLLGDLLGDACNYVGVGIGGGLFTALGISILNPAYASSEMILTSAGVGAVFAGAVAGSADAIFKILNSEYASWGISGQFIENTVAFTWTWINSITVPSLIASGLMLPVLAKGRVDFLGLENLKIAQSLINWEQLLALQTATLIVTAVETVVVSVGFGAVWSILSLASDKPMDAIVSCVPNIPSFIGTWTQAPILLGAVYTAAEAVKSLLRGFGYQPEWHHLNFFEHQSLHSLGGQFVQALIADTSLSMLGLNPKNYFLCNTESVGKYILSFTGWGYMGGTFLALNLSIIKHIASSFANLEIPLPGHLGKTGMKLGFTLGFLAEGAYHAFPEQFKYYMDPSHRSELIFGAAGFLTGFFNSKTGIQEGTPVNQMLDVIGSKKHWAWGGAAALIGTTSGSIVDKAISFLSGGVANTTQTDTGSKESQDIGPLISELKETNKRLEVLINLQAIENLQQKSVIDILLLQVEKQSIQQEAAALIKDLQAYKERSSQCANPT